VTDEKLNVPPPPDAFANVEFGVMVRLFEPEQATVCEKPWPNSIPEFEFSVILPAKVV
jgi:hypothetical protein